MELIKPKKLNPNSFISLIHTSSPLEKQDEKQFQYVVDRLTRHYPNTKVFNIHETKDNPSYLSGSERERLRNFRKAIKKSNWLLPVAGGTGCEDIIRHLNDNDLVNIRKNQPIVNGFSDTIFLINYLYFKIKLMTFHYSNATNLYTDKNSKTFFECLMGIRNELIYHEPDYKWLTDPIPAAPISGIAIGGNFSTFRDLLDICDIRPRSWEPYILFIEEVGMDVEDLHRLIISLDERGIFRHVRALVIGDMDQKIFTLDLRRYHFSYVSHQDNMDNLFEYMLGDVIKERNLDGDPLHMLKVTNLGHFVKKNPMIIPIGAPVTLYPDGHIQFQGPFVE